MQIESVYIWVFATNAAYKCPQTNKQTNKQTGLKVDALTLSGEKYKPYKGVRFVTKAGRFQVRS